MGKLKQFSMEQAEKHGHTVYLICTLLHEFPDMYKANALQLTITQHKSAEEGLEIAWNEAFDALAEVFASTFPIEPAEVTVQDIKQAHRWMITTADDDILRPPV